MFRPAAGRLALVRRPPSFRQCRRIRGPGSLLFFARHSALLRVWSAEPEVGAAWGAFGAIFTAIAVAHTLYAPREVILWNWRRIVLLGLSLALAVGSQFSLVVVVPAALAFMLYLAPTRGLAAFVIWLVACANCTCALDTPPIFSTRTLSGRGWCTRSFFGVSWKAYTMPQAYHQVLAQIGQSSPCAGRGAAACADHLLQPGAAPATLATRRRCWSRFSFWHSRWARRTIPASVFNSWRCLLCSFRGWHRR